MMKWLERRRKKAAERRREYLRSEVALAIALGLIGGLAAVAIVDWWEERCRTRKTSRS